MKISLDWLSDFVVWDDTPTALAAKLTAVGLNVEGIEAYEQSFPSVVVAQVTHREQHPNADRLSLCSVDDGSGEAVQVVCGAPNVREGITVAFARVGAVLPGNFKIKKSKIRGEQSFGMICSGAELGVSVEGNGIIELDTELTPGTPIDEIYGFQDTILDIEVTPNRPDWLSHVGVAREVAAVYGTKMSLPTRWNPQQSGESLGIKVNIHDYAECPRFMAFGVQNVVTRPSPKWMQDRLRAIGSRSISNVVDITNYVMFELGQPLHAYDRSKLAGAKITVSSSQVKQKLVTLDGQTRTIDPGTLLICDESGPVGLAGVMGLANSEVTPGTSELLLESGFFNPLLVRQGSRGLGLISEASYRFERGGDWEMVETAAHRALHLFQELADAHIIPDWADRGDPDRRPAPDIPLRVWQVNRLLGAKVSLDQAAQYLQALGLKVQPMGNPEVSSPNAVNMMVKVPSFRRDLSQEVDLIEEIVRSHGLSDLVGRPGLRAGGVAGRPAKQKAMQKARTWLAANGYHELVTSSFATATDQDRLGLTTGDVRYESIRVINPHHGGDTLLRTVLLPSLLETAARNLNAGTPTPVRMFQINRTYWPAGSKVEEPRHADEVLLPEEPLFLQFAVIGDRTVGMGGVPSDLLELKGTVAALATFLRLPLTLATGDVETWLEPGTQWRILFDGDREVGTAGRVLPAVAGKFDLEVPVAVAELRLSSFPLAPQAVHFVPFPRFPGTTRDLSLLVPDGVTFGQISETTTAVGGPLLAAVDLFDIYRGKGVSAEHGAYGIRLKFQSAKGNLKGKAVDKAIVNILAELKDSWQIEPRV